MENQSRATYETMLEAYNRINAILLAPHGMATHEAFVAARNRFEKECKENDWSITEFEKMYLEKNS